MSNCEDNRCREDQPVFRCVKVNAKRPYRKKEKGMKYTNVAKRPSRGISTPVSKGATALPETAAALTKAVAAVISSFPTLTCASVM